MDFTNMVGFQVSYNFFIVLMPSLHNI